MLTSLEQIVGQKWMWSFQGHTPPPDFLAALRAGQVSGLTLFRSMNLDHPAQICLLTGAVQRAAREARQPPLLIGVDQEGGTRLAVPGTTRLPYDAGAYPRVPTCLCTYRLQPASLQAAAKVLWGQIAAQGQLPVKLP